MIRSVFIIVCLHSWKVTLGTPPFILTRERVIYFSLSRKLYFGGNGEQPKSISGPSVMRMSPTTIMKGSVLNEC